MGKISNFFKALFNDVTTCEHCKKYYPDADITSMGYSLVCVDCVKKINKSNYNRNKQIADELNKELL